MIRKNSGYLFSTFLRIGPTGSRNTYIKSIVPTTALIARIAAKLRIFLAIAIFSSDCTYLSLQIIRPLLRS